MLRAASRSILARSYAKTLFQHRPKHGKKLSQLLGISHLVQYSVKESSAELVFQQHLLVDRFSNDLFYGHKALKVHRLRYSPALPKNVYSCGAFGCSM